MCMVSVATSFYNDNKYTEQLFNILKDNYKTLKTEFSNSEMELVIVNDSSEITVDLNFINVKFEYRVITHECNLGIQQARVTGLDNCKGDYILFLDQDDELFENAIVKQFELLINENSDMVICNALNAAKIRNIKLVFTAHDFFQICPKVTMFRHGAICSDAKTCEGCGECNTTAMSLKKINVLQSPLYRELKDSLVVKKLRKRHRDDYLSEPSGDSEKQVGTVADYKRLRDYYYSLLSCMDMIHYNSSVTKKVYESFFELPNNCIVSITHSDINDNRVKKNFVDGQLRIRYLGPMRGDKGYFILKASLDELWKERQDFCLDVHFTPTEMPPYMKVHDRYAYSDLKDIFNNTDLLVAPSVWYETFGFTVLEALSYGVPVVVSGTVGAKDILLCGAGIVIENSTPQKLCDAMKNLSVAKLEKMNQVIVKVQHIMQIQEMSSQIE